MKKLLLIPTLFFVSLTLFAQDSTLNMSLLFNWDVDTLPAASGIRYNDIWGYTACDNREYAIMGSAAYVHFLEVSDPANVYEIAAFPGGENTIWRDMKTYRDRAYAVSDGTSEGLMIFDLSGLPDTVVKTYHSNEFFNRAHNIFIDEENGRLYAVGSNSANIVVLDLSDPDQPTLLANAVLPGGGSAHDVFVRDNIAYVSQEWRGFYTWDMTVPTNPILIGSVVTGNYNHSSWITNDGRYALYAEEVPTGLPLGVIDMEDPGGFTVVNTFKFPLLAPAATNNTPHNPFIRGKYAIVSYYHDGLQIFDIEDVMNPIQVAFYDTHENSAYNGYNGNWGTYPFLPSGNILASDIQRGLMVLRADSIELIASPEGTPDATLTIDGPDNFCEGDSAILRLPPNAKSFAWYKDDQLLGNTSNELIISESGTYYGVASNGHCSATSNSLEISVTAYPDLSDLPAGDTLLCPTDSILLSGPAGMDEYIWTNNGDVLPTQESSYLIQSPGSYQLLTSLNGCSSSSNVLNVSVEEIPSIELEVESNIRCFSTGDTLFITAFPDSLRYDWYVDNEPFSFDTNRVHFLYDPNEMVSFQASSANCRQESIPIEITAPVPTVPVISQSGDTLYASDALSYQWYLDGEPIVDATDFYFVPETSGIYTVETVDANECTTLSEEFIFVISSARELQALQSIQLQPNPFREELTIHLSENVQGRNVHFTIYSNDGRTILTSQFKTQQKQFNWNLDQLQAGFYWLTIEDEAGNRISKKLIKM